MARLISSLAQEWFRELSFSRLECRIHDKLHISSADWWDLLLPLAYTPDRRDRRLLLSRPKDTGKARQTELPKFRSEIMPQRDSNPGPPGRQSNILSYPHGHRAPTASLNENRKFDNIKERYNILLLLLLN